MESRFEHPFPPADKAAWLAQVQKELKGEPYESLAWSTGDGFTMEPYYTPADLADLPIADIQRVQKQAPGWLNAPEQTVTDVKSTNQQLLDSVNGGGADALVLNLPANFAPTTDALSRLLNGIKLSDTPVFFRLQLSISPSDQAAFISALKTVAPYQLRGGLLTEAEASTADAIRLTTDSPQFRTVCVGSHAFHNAGATAAQELAFLLARLTDIFDQLTEAGLTPDQIAAKTVLSISVGTSYFAEIAKLRALRVLYDRFLRAYGITFPAFIHAQTSLFYEATATPYTNLLRTTTEALAAVVSGCDALTVRPYDAVFEATNDFSERIARNVSALLRDESYLDKVADPAAGSYYVETLTHQLTEAAWTLFLTVEEQGGYASALANGFIGTELERAYRTKVDAVQAGRTLVGVTKFRFDEPSWQPASANVKAASPLPVHRLAETFE